MSFEDAPVRRRPRPPRSRRAIAPEPSRPPRSARSTSSRAAARSPRPRRLRRRRSRRRIPSAATNQANTPQPGGGEELEDLFGEGKRPAAPPAREEGDATGPLSMDAAFQVRRRSGKVFGPFPADAIAEMLQKGELQGNEDVSSDARRDVAADERRRGLPRRRRQGQRAAADAPVPAAAYGTRMAPARLGEGAGPIRTRPRWLKYAIRGRSSSSWAGSGARAPSRKYGPFFIRAFRSDAERNRIAAVVARAKEGLARGGFAGEKEALALASEALAAAPDDADAQLAFVLAAAAVERRHAATPDATQRAATAAADLAGSAKGKPHALAARLALALGAGDLASLSQLETALDQAIAIGRPDPELVALLARSALARRDGAQAAARFKRLAELQPGTARAVVGAGLALAAQGKAREAREAFERALAADAALPDARLAVAAIAAAAGDDDDARVFLAPLLEPSPAIRLAPLDRARALAIAASLLSRRAADAPQAEKLLGEAVAADARCIEARVALARHRLRRGDPQGAVVATDPVAAGAARLPDLADVRARALVGAGRALDAAQLTEAALAAAPGDPHLLVARGMVQEQTGKLADAQATYRDAIARAPGAWEARIALARMAMAGKELALAQEQITAAVERSGKDAAPHAALGELKQAQGDVAGAEAAFGKALAQDEEHAPALVGLARIALARGDVTAAREGVDRALEIEPRRAEARRLRGELRWRAGDLKGAEADFKAATERQGRDPLGFARLGAVRLERGDVAGAMAARRTPRGST